MQSRRGIYLGVSKEHSSTVHLVLNPSTGKVSPQYHVVFDDHFATVASNGQFDIDVWHSLVSSNQELHLSVETTSDGIIVIPPDHKPFEVLPTLDPIDPIPLPTSIDPITPSVPEGDHVIPLPFSPEGAQHIPLPFV